MHTDNNTLLFGDDVYATVKKAKKELHTAGVQYIFIHEENEDRPRLLTKEYPKGFRGLHAIKDYCHFFKKTNKIQTA